MKQTIIILVFFCIFCGCTDDRKITTSNYFIENTTSIGAKVTFFSIRYRKELTFNIPPKNRQQIPLDINDCPIEAQWDNMCSDSLKIIFDDNKMKKNIYCGNYSSFNPTLFGICRKDSVNIYNRIQLLDSKTYLFRIIEDDYREAR